MPADTTHLSTAEPVEPASDAGGGTQVSDSSASAADWPPLPPPSTSLPMGVNPLVQAVQQAVAERANRGLPHVPGYEVQAELGKGGMGIVYQGWDLQLKRPVALKFLRTERSDNPELRRRFQVEAEANARLQHPHLVQVFEYGELDRQPYLVQEYVPGGNLAQRLAHQPQPPRDAAVLLARLARTMHYAHSLGIVHRDLKPANILLALAPTGEVRGMDSASPTPVTPGSSVAQVPPAAATRLSEVTPKITDFGLVKLLDVEEVQTRSEALVGTPYYMAPEQVATRLADGRRNPITPSVDIYALGAILYEMLTGRVPFLGATVWDTLDQVLRDDPVPPHRLQPRIPHDLETVCLKCLHKDPLRRYATAEALADDLERYLRDEPVHARRAGPVERTVKWARRRPALAALSLVCTLALLALLIGGAVYNALLTQALDRARRNEAEAQVQQRAADAARRTAEEHYRRALEAVDQFQVRLTDRTAEVPEMEEIRRQSLEDALRFYGQFLAEKDHPDPEVRHRTADALRRMAIVEQSLVRFRDAGEHLEQALRMVEQLRKERPAEYGLLKTLLDNHASLCVNYRHLGQQPEAERHGLAALDLSRQLATFVPEDEGLVGLRAGIYLNLGNVLQSQGRLADAVDRYEEGLRLLRERRLQFPAAPDTGYLQAKFHFNLGILHEGLNDRARSIAHLRTCYDLQAALRQAAPQKVIWQTELAETCDRLGQVYARQNNLADAERLYGEALQLRQGLVRNYPRAKAFQFALARGHGSLGRFYFSRGQHALGREQMRLELAAYRQLITLAPEDAYVQISLALAVANNTHYLPVNEQEAALAEAEKILVPVVRQHPENIEWTHALAQVWLLYGSHLYAQGGRSADARQRLTLGIDLLDKQGARVMELSALRVTLGELLRQRGRTHYAAKDYAATLRDCDRFATLAPGDLLNPWLRVDCLLRLGDHARGIAALQPLVAPGKIYSLTEVAQLYCLAVTAVQHDPHLPFFRRLFLAERYTSQALAALQKERSYKAFLPPEQQHVWRTHVRQHPDLAPLRGRGEFTRLVGTRSESPTPTQQKNR